MTETPTITLEQVISMARQLPALEKIQLIERIAPEIEHDLRKELGTPRPRKSLLGLCADLGPAPSEQDIDEVRREMWAGFPRDDIRKIQTSTVTAVW
jgi:hypothetical protein